MKRLGTIVASALLALEALCDVAVTGAVKDSDKKPLPGAIVEGMAGDKRWETAAGSGGKFVLSVPDSLPELRIMASAPGYLTALMEIRLGGASVDVGEIRLHPSEATELGEVVVTASPTIIKADKTLLFPSSLEKSRSFSTDDLLQQLSYRTPELRADLASGAVTVDGMPPIILVNGLKRSREYLRSIKPSDIERVEVSSLPNPKYGGECWINIITAKPPQGGMLECGIKDLALTTPQEGQTLTSAYRRGKNEFLVNYSGEYREFNRMANNSTEAFESPEKSVELDYRGLPSSRKVNRYHRGIAEYTRSAGDKGTLVVSAKFRSFNIDRIQDYDVSTAAGSYAQSGSNKFKELEQGYSAYYEHKLPRKGALVAMASWAHSSGDYDYRMSATNGFGTSTLTHNRTDSWYAAASYSGTFGRYRLSALATFHSNKSRDRLWSDGERQPDCDLSLTEWVATTSASGNLAGVDAYLSAGVERKDIKAVSWSPWVSFRASRSFGKTTLRYALKHSSSPNSLSSYSQAVTQIDEYLYETGNPLTKFSQTLSNRLTATFSCQAFYANADLGIQSTRHPAVTEYYYDDDPGSAYRGFFFRSTANARRETHWTAAGSAGAYNLLGHLSLWVDGGWEKTEIATEAKTYRLSRGRLSAQCSVFFGDWQATASVPIVRRKELQRDLSVNSFSKSYWLMIGWKRGHWNVTASWSNMLTSKAGRRESVSLSEVHPYKETYWCGGTANLVEVSVLYRVSFGDAPRGRVSGIMDVNSIDTGH